MDYQTTDLIKTKLNQNGFEHVSQEINERIASGSTGGEIASAVFHYLFNLEKENRDAYLLIVDEVEYLKKYAVSIGLYIYY